MCGNLVDRNQPVEDFSSKLIRSECWRRTGSGWRSGDGRQDGTGPHSRSTADDRASNSDSAASPTGAKTKKTSHPFASFIILNDAGARAGRLGWGGGGCRYRGSALPMFQSRAGCPLGCLRTPRAGDCWEPNSFLSLQETHTRGSKPTFDL